MAEMVPTLVNARWSLKLPDFRAERVEWSDPGWEVERLDSMHANIKPGDVVYDVGTEEGDLSGLYALWGAQLVLIEPNERVWPCAKAIFETNKLSPPLCCYVGFAADEDRFDPVSPELGWQPSWPKCADGPLVRAHDFKSLAESRERLPCVRLDKMTQVVRPDAITIDVEGSELRVLRGAEQTLKEHRPLVWVSVHPEQMFSLYGDSHSELHEFMGQCGYTSKYLSTDHEQHWLFKPKP